MQRGTVGAVVWSIFVIGCSGSSRGSPSAAADAGASAPKSFAHLGHWHGWFEDTVHDDFSFTVYGDRIADINFAAAKPGTMCTVIKIGTGTAYNGDITDNAFAFNFHEMTISGDFLDAEHAEVRFSNVSANCSMADGASYDAYWVEDPCTSGTPKFGTMYGLTAGTTKALELRVSPLVSANCEAQKVADGTVITLKVDDLGGTGTKLKATQVTTVDGVASASVVAGAKAGKFQIVATVEGIAPASTSEQYQVSN